MREILTIENFGPIKKMSFDFKKINILIGDQGTGKSLTAKTLIAVRNTMFIDIFDIEPSATIDKETLLFLEHMRLVGVFNYITDKTRIEYRHPEGVLVFTDKKAVVSRYNFKLGEILPPNFTYVPAERNMISVLADSLYALIEVKAELPKLFLRFGNKYQSARRFKENFDYNDILGVQFFHRNNGDYIVTLDDTIINLSDASSGIQGCIALLTVVDNVMYTQMISGRRIIPAEVSLNLLAIEEPELNLFPATQKKLLNYIIANNFVNIDADDIVSPKLDVNRKPFEKICKNQLLITTHSPYILTSLNNLMYAFSVGQNNEQEVNKIVEEQYWINPDDVSAYMLLPNGECEAILDKEEKLIKAEKIDEVSGFLNEQFDALLKIELSKK